MRASVAASPDAMTNDKCTLPPRADPQQTALPACVAADHQRAGSPCGTARTDGDVDLGGCEPGGWHVVAVAVERAHPFGAAVESRRIKPRPWPHPDDRRRVRYRASQLCRSRHNDAAPSAGGGRLSRVHLASLDATALSDALDGATRRIVAEVDAPPAVLVITTFDDDASLFDALRAGAAGFLLKSAPPEQLVDAVRIVAAGGGWESADDAT